MVAVNPVPLIIFLVLVYSAEFFFYGDAIYEQFLPEIGVQVEDRVVQFQNNGTIVRMKVARGIEADSEPKTIKAGDDIYTVRFLNESEIASLNVPEEEIPEFAPKSGIYATPLGDIYDWFNVIFSYMPQIWAFFIFDIPDIPPIFRFMFVVPTSILSILLLLDIFTVIIGIFPKRGGGNPP